MIRLVMQVSLGALFTVAGWLLSRRVAKTPLVWSAALPVDLLIPVLLFANITAASQRPVVAGLTTLSLGAGFAFADRAKRKVLEEPIVFTDVLQAFDIFRHPRLALPFPNKLGVLLGSISCLVVFAAMFRFDPSAWRWSVWPFLIVSTVTLVVATVVAGPALPFCSRQLRRLTPSADPLLDSARFGPFALLLIYGIVARGERKVRLGDAFSGYLQRDFQGPAASVSLSSNEGPIILVQSESFFDIRRLHPDIPRDLLPAFDECCRSSQQWGRLIVPSWGANTVRTEAAVLTGLSQEALGMDRFNPYQALRTQPVPSLATTLRARGYRTICLHPFDRSFYGRDRVMPRLGFDEFIGEEAFSGARISNGYVADLEVARVAAEIIAAKGPKVFLFVITMENHGPWIDALSSGLSPELLCLGLPEAEGAAFQGYLQGLSNADLMIDQLKKMLSGFGVAEGTLAFYGDHLPSFPGTFSKLGLKDNDSDYFIWKSKGSPINTQANFRALAAHQFPDALLRAINFVDPV